MYAQLERAFPNQPLGHKPKHKIARYYNDRKGKNKTKTKKLLYSRVNKAADLWAKVANTAKWSLAPQ